MKTFVITGMPASGKTYYTDFLLKYCSINYKVAHIYGDAIAHISYGCSYTKEQMDLKYTNICSIIANICKRKYDILIIDDLFKRKEDFQKIYLLESLNPQIIYLEANEDDLLERNKKRPQYHRLSDEKMQVYIHEYKDTIVSNAISVKINVSESSRYLCKKRLVEFVDKVMGMNKNEYSRSI